MRIEKEGERERKREREREIEREREREGERQRKSGSRWECRGARLGGVGWLGQGSVG